MNPIQPYEQNFSIYSYLVDIKLDLTLSNLMCFFQEVAWAHSNREDAGWKFLQSKEMFWALIKFYLKIHRMPQWEEKIKVRTWAKATKQIIYPRDFEVVDESGNLLVAATSDWVILDKKNFRPQKNILQEEEKMILDRFAIQENIPKIPKINFSEEEGGCKSVLYSDIDMNQHVNNTRYLMWAIDDYDPDFIQTHSMTTCCIHYLSQTKLGTQYAIKREEIAHNQFVTTIFTKNDGRELCRIQMNWKRR